jgi:hypothetical protein
MCLLMGAVTLNPHTRKSLFSALTGIDLTKLKRNSAALDAFSV